MTLQSLSLTPEREATYREQLDPGMTLARVTAVDRERYLVHDGAHEFRAELTGRLFHGVDSPEELPTTGDWVGLQEFDDGDLGIIHRVLPRWSLLRRKAPGRRSEFQLIGANIDLAYIVQSVDGNVNLRRLERYLVTVRDAGITPVLLISKSDLAEQSFLDEISADILAGNPGLDLRLLSSIEGRGPDQVREEIRGAGTACLLGSSGVGKTTLLNAMLGGEIFATNAVRESDGRGRHTTTRRQLVLMPGGGVIIDTPGMRELGTMAADDGIDATFPEITPLLDKCRFRDCTHAEEAGCALRTAVDEGEVEADRYHSFMKLQRESRFHEMSWLEKRERDRKFGKMVKTIVKTNDKRRGR